MKFLKSLIAITSFLSLASFFSFADDSYDSSRPYSYGSIDVMRDHVDKEGGYMLFLSLQLC